MQAVAKPREQRILLSNIAWETYERLLADHLDSSAPRFAYDRGLLEIVSPSTEHEERNRTLASLVEVVAEETTVDFRNVGSMTFKRRDLERGFEPDSCFYIQNEPRVSGRVQIDLASDPPPDLLLEIDIANSSLNKMPIYAQIGVPEVWRDDGERIIILLLHRGEYRSVATSAALPILTSDVLTHFVAQSKTLKRIAWLHAVRVWVRGQARIMESTS